MQRITQIGCYLAYLDGRNDLYVDTLDSDMQFLRNGVILNEEGAIDGCSTL